MGSSYRQDLRRGHDPAKYRDGPSWEERLREAARLIHSVRHEIDVYGTGQYDNAADDGGLKEVLTICRNLILKELPKEADDGA